MGDFANGPVSRVFSMILSLLVIAVNTYFVLTYVVNLGITNLALIMLLVVFGLVYLLFCLYLSVDMVLAMGLESLAFIPIVRRIFSVSTMQGNYAIHGEEEDGDSSELEDTSSGEENVSERPGHI